MVQVNNIPNFIEVYNVYSKDICETLIHYFNESEKAGLAINRRTETADKLTRDDNACYLTPIEVNARFLPNDMTNGQLVNKVKDIFWQQAYVKYAEKYDILKQCHELFIFTLKLQKTMPGEGYHVWHAEAMNRFVNSRILVYTVYLNDDFEAGETEFLYQQYRYVPKQGDVVIFPGAFTHVHRGNPPIGNSKYILTGWLEF